MLESELNDREFNDSAGGGRGTEELTPPAPSVPAAVFQPPPSVVFQPPSIQPEPAESTRSAEPSRSEPSRSESSRSRESSRSAESARSGD
jgi:hypothetical protein